MALQSLIAKNLPELLQKCFIRIICDFTQTYLTANLFDVTLSQTIQLSNFIALVER